METRTVFHEAWSSPSQGQRENCDEVEESDDTISVMAGNEFPSHTSQEVHESAAKPSESATKPVDTANKPTENSLSLIPNMLSSFGEKQVSRPPQSVDVRPRREGHIVVSFTSIS